MYQGTKLTLLENLTRKILIPDVTFYTDAG